MRALAFKELREVVGIAAAALAGYLALAVNLMGAKVFDWVPGIPAGTHEVPFVGGGFELFFTFVSVMLAAALGFRQSAWESARGTYLFLLHRPLSREAVFLTKLATGSAVLVGCAAVPVLVYGAWASAPGHHAGSTIAQRRRQSAAAVFMGGNDRTIGVPSLGASPDAPASGMGTPTRGPPLLLRGRRNS